MNIKGIVKSISCNKKFILLSIALWIFLSCLMILSYQEEWRGARTQLKYVNGFQNASETEVEELVIKNSTVITQTLEINNDEFTGVSLWFNAEVKPENGKIVVELLEVKSEKTILKASVNMSELAMGQFNDFLFEKQMNAQKDSEYVVRVIVEEASEVEVKIPLAKVSKESKISMCINDEPSEYAMEYKVINGSYNSLKFLWFAFYMAMTLSFFLTVVLFLKKVKLEWIFVTLILTIGGMYAFAVPMFSVPDEPSHFVTTYAQSSILLGEEALDDNGNILVADSSLWNLGDSKPSKDTYLRNFVGALGGGTEETGQYVATRTPLEMRHLGYFPQVIGVSIARLLEWNCEQLLLLGRLFALCWYAFIMYWAIKLMPFGKMAMFILASFPMTMQMVVSYNYDSVLLGICFFLFAYLQYLIYQKKKIDIKNILILILIGSVIASIKFIYLPVLGLILFVPSHKFKSKKHKYIATVVVMGISVVILLYLKLSMLQEFSVSRVSGSAEGMSITVGYALEHLDEMWEMLLHTFVHQMTFYYTSLIGSPLGWMDLWIPEPILCAWTVLFVIGLFSNDQVKSRNVVGIKMFSLVIAFGMFFMTLAAMLFGWTKLGSPVIEGVQGRYFLPFLPLVILLFNSKNSIIVVEKTLEKYLILSMVFLQCFVIYYVSMTIVGR